MASSTNNVGSSEIPPHMYMDWRTIPLSGDTKNNEVRKNGLGPFHVLHDELIFRILKYLSNSDLLRLSLVSRAFYFYAEDDLMVWKRRALNRWQGNFVYKDTWKRTALLPARKEPRPPYRRLPLKGFYSKFLCDQWYRQFVPMSMFETLPPGYRGVERRSNLSVQEFIDRYDAPGMPVIVTDVVPQWRAWKERLWEWNRLEARFGDVAFKTDEVCDGRKIKVPFREYLAYARSNCDEDPIYLFDPEFGERAPELLQEYRVPDYFAEDLFALLGERRRPFYRWLVLGPARSGSAFHIDPYRTSAWNAVLVGRKRWLLYPPGVVPPGVEEERDSDDSEPSYDAPEPLKYMTRVYPHIPPDRRPIECILEPGEMIFVPTNWWHMVLNLDDTVAVTQNIMNSQNFREVYRDVKRDDRKMKKKLRKRIKKGRPDLYEKFLRRHKPAPPTASSPS